MFLLKGDLVKTKDSDGYIDIIKINWNCFENNVILPSCLIF